MPLPKLPQRPDDDHEHRGWELVNLAKSAMWAGCYLLVFACVGEGFTQAVRLIAVIVHVSTHSA